MSDQLKLATLLHLLLHLPFTPHVLWRVVGHEDEEVARGLLFELADGAVELVEAVEGVEMEANA